MQDASLNSGVDPFTPIRSIPSSLKNTPSPFRWGDISLDMISPLTSKKRNLGHFEDTKNKNTLNEGNNLLNFHIRKDNQENLQNNLLIRLVMRKRKVRIMKNKESKKMTREDRFIDNNDERNRSMISGTVIARDDNDNSIINQGNLSLLNNSNDLIKREKKGFLSNTKNSKIFEKNILNGKYLKIDFKDKKQKKKKSSCSCLHSRCLKLYCECLKAGKFCGPSCLCVNCKNFIDNPKRRKVIKKIERKRKRNLTLFRISKKGEDNFHIKKKGCSCEKNRCLTLYCSCKREGKSCNKSCRCVGCCNRVNSGSEEDELKIVGKSYLMNQRR